MLQEYPISATQQQTVVTSPRNDRQAMSPRNDHQSLSPRNRQTLLKLNKIDQVVQHRDRHEKNLILIIKYQTVPVVLKDRFLSERPVSTAPVHGEQELFWSIFLKRH